MVKKYEVTMVITNTYLVDADNEQDAELKVRDLGVWDTLAGADFAVTDVEEVRKEADNEGHFDGSFYYGTRVLGSA